MRRTIGLVAVLFLAIITPTGAVEVQFDGRTVDLPVCGGTDAANMGECRLAD